MSESKKAGIDMGKALDGKLDGRISANYVGNPTNVVVNHPAKAPVSVQHWAEDACVRDMHAVGNHKFANGLAKEYEANRKN